MQAVRLHDWKQSLVGELAEELALLLASGELVSVVEGFDFAGASDALEALGAGCLRDGAVLALPAG